MARRVNRLPNVTDRRVGIRVDGGWDVQIIDNDGWPTFTQRCTTRDGADFVAASYRRDLLRAGRTDD